MRSPPTIAAVVEGHGEVQAVPILLRRVASEIFGVHYVVLPPPFRVKRQLMTRKAGLANAVAVQAARVGEHGGVLIMADADDDCAVTLADEVRRVAAPTPVEVAVAVREFEAWFLGAVESLRGHRSVRGDAGFGGDPEEPRGAKGVLAAVMTEPYRETLHQPAFAASMDLHAAQRLRSFVHLVSCVGRIIKQDQR